MKLSWFGSLWAVLPLLAATVQIPAQQRSVLTCAYASWASYRKLPGRVMGNELPAQICTHAIYLYAAMVNNTLTPFDAYNDMSGSGRRGNIDKFVSLKNKNPKLKTIIGVGGWNAGGFMFSQMAMNATTRKTFIDSVVVFCKQYSFDGLLIDWLTPGIGNRGGDPEDYQNFPKLLKEAKAAFKKEVTGRADDLLIAITLSADVANIDYYDVENLNAGVDLYYLLTYDFYGPWTRATYHHSPLFNVPGNYSMDSAVQGWLKTTIDRQKIAVSITGTARSYTIPIDDSDDAKKIGIRIVGDGKPGPITGSNGTFAYFEVCRMIASGSYIVFRDPITKVSHAYSYDGDLWFSFDNEASVREKANYTLANKLGGGVMIFTSDQDDPNGYCGPPYPLSRAVREVLSPLPATENQAFLTDLNTRIESRCLSQQTQAGGCETTLRCSKISPASFSPGELDCPAGKNCSFALSGMDCVMPVGTTIKKDQQVYIQSSTSLPATYTKLKWQLDSIAGTADTTPKKFYIPHDTGFSGDALQEFACTSGYQLKDNSVVCVLNSV